MQTPYSIFPPKLKSLCVDLAKAGQTEYTQRERCQVPLSQPMGRTEHTPRERCQVPTVALHTADGHKNVCVNDVPTPSGASTRQTEDRDVSGIGEQQLKDPELEPYFVYLEQKILPDDKKAAKRMAAERTFYKIEDGVLYHAINSTNTDA